MCISIQTKAKKYTLQSAESPSSHTVLCIIYILIIKGNYLSNVSSHLNMQNPDFSPMYALLPMGGGSMYTTDSKAKILQWLEWHGIPLKIGYYKFFWLTFPYWHPKVSIHWTAKEMASWLRAFSRIKPLPSALQEVQEHSESLKRCLSTFDLICYGVGCSVGAGVYSLIGVGAEITGPSISVSFLVSGIACIFTSLTYSEFSARVPVSGSNYLHIWLLECWSANVRNDMLDYRICLHICVRNFWRISSMACWMEFNVGLWDICRFHILIYCSRLVAMNNGCIF